ncbi:hypothetical protein NXW50_30945, partial [Bacteroides thetaiotaomicron]|nr:hypothetical protein [Bacteroides thetaiotaomicron]
NEFGETPYYLMIDELSGKGQITVKYWTTNCEVGNRIQAGVNLSPNAPLTWTRRHWLWSVPPTESQAPKTKRSSVSRSKMPRFQCAYNKKEGVYPYSPTSGNGRPAIRVT